MAYVSATKSSESASAATFTPELSDHESGDVLVIWAVHYRLGTTISIDGTDTSNFTDPVGSFDTKETGTGVTNCACALFICEAASSSEAGPLLTQNTAADEWNAVCYTIKDAKLTDVIEAANTAAFGSATNGTFPTVTPTNAGCLVLYFQTTDVNTSRASNFKFGVEGYNNFQAASGYAISSAAFQHHEASAVTPAVLWAGGSGAHDGVHATIAINTAASTLEAGVDVDNVNSTMLFPNPIAAPSAALYGISAVSVDRTSLFDTGWTTTLGFTTPVNIATAGGVTYPFRDESKGFGQGIGFVATSTPSHAGQHVMTTWTIPSTSFSSKMLIGSMGIESGGSRVGAVSDGGCYVVLSDGTEIAVYRVSAVDSSPTASTGQIGFIIDPTNPTYESANSGAINLGAIVGVGVMAYCASVPVRIFITGVHLLDISSNKNIIVRGGYASRPLNFEKPYGTLISQGPQAEANQRGYTAGQYFTHVPIQIGDGSVTTITDLSNSALAFPGAATSKYLAYPINTSALQLRIKASATDNFTTGPCSIDMGDFHQFIEDSATSDTDIYNYDKLVVLNGSVTLQGAKTNINRAGSSWVGCKKLTLNAPTTTSTARVLNGVTVSSVATGQTASIEDITTEEHFKNAVTGATFTNNTNAPAIRITGNQSHTGAGWADPGLTVSGNTVDIEYTGATNFSIQSATSLTVSNTGAGVLTIVTPVTQLEVTSNIASSDIKIFETGTQTIEASGTGTSVTTTTAGTYDITVQKAGYLPQRKTGVVLGASSVTESIILVKDPVYSASHGLAYTTDFTYNRTTKKLTCVTRQAGRDFYSAMIDAFIAQSSLDNTPFPLTAVGIDSIFFNDDAELLDATSQDNWFDAGIRYINSSGTTTAEWCSIKSSGSIPTGVTGRYQTGAGTGTTALRTTGAVNQIIQIYGDATHGNFDHRSYLVIKFQANPYVDTRSDILALAGVSTLEPFEYSVAIEPTALDITAGDSGAVLTLVDHTAAPITVGGKSFSYEIQDGGTNSAEAILRAWDYNIAQTGTYQGTDTFNLPEFIAQSGSTYETRRGIVETKGSTLYGCYVSRGGSDHPDFTRHQSDDGTYYDKPVTANITITNLPDDVGGNTRLQIYNVTTATEYYNDDPAGTGYSASYTDGVGISSGDQLRIRFAHLNAGTSFEYGQTFVTASSSGFSADGSTFIAADSVYASNGINGSTITNFTADFVEDQIEIASDTDFTAAQAYAFYCYQLTNTTGIGDFWGGVTAIDTGNYRINTSVVSIYFDSPVGVTYSVKQTDTGRIFRSDDAYPVKDPTTSGYGVQLNWKNVVYVQNVGGSALTAAESAALTSIKSKTDSLTFTVAGQVDANCESMNAHALQGDGSESDKIRTVNAP